MDIKAIFFDASETLIHLPRGVAHDYKTVAARHGLQLDERRVATAFREMWKARPARSVCAAGRPDDDKGWWRDLVGDVLVQCGARLDGTAFAALFEELYAHFAQPGVWELYPDVAPALAELKARFPLGVISNFDRRLYQVFRHAGIADYFDAIIISSEVGADKPHPQIFEKALASLNVAPSEALHVGDDPVRDWQGAAAAGMHCFQLDRRKNSLLDVAKFVEVTNRSGS